MDPWIWWVVAGIVLVVIEVTTLDLTFLMLGAGGLAGALAAGLGAGLPVQFAVAAIVAIAGLGVVRPVALRHLRQPVESRTGVAALVGTKAVVIERVDARGGRVKLAGEVWSARSFDADAVYEAGQDVDVVEIDGATALVL